MQWPDLSDRYFHNVLIEKKLNISKTVIAYPGVYVIHKGCLVYIIEMAMKRVVCYVFSHDATGA